MSFPNRRGFRDMPQVDLVLIPDLGQPRSFTYSSVEEARFNARGLSRRGPQRFVAWYVLDDDGLILASHGYDLTSLKSLRPDAHTQTDVVRAQEIERSQDMLGHMALERSAYGLFN